MGIIDWYTNNLNDEERSLTRDLISVAIADNEFSEEEKKAILKICEQENISKEELIDSIREPHARKTALHTMAKKKSYLLHLIRIMAADNKHTPLELHVIELLASSINVTPMQIISFVVDETKDHLISQEEGLKIIDSIAKYFTSIGA